MATRYSGNVQIRLSFVQEYGWEGYCGRVRVDGHSYAVSVTAPVLSVAYDSPEAYDNAAHAMLSFADNDREWSEGSDIFGAAAEVGDSGWIIRRTKAGKVVR